MRGERRRGLPSHVMAAGSSPHARGTLVRVRRGQHTDRFIPACAGNALSSLPSPSAFSVHPRMRGERFRKLDRLFMRVWFIPACAGNAQAHHHHRRSTPVHPRMRGERWQGDASYGITGGSSPHAWGTQHARRGSARLVRFIPACAGNASRPRCAHAARSVHPRMRGERCADVLPGVEADGSSPHARGTRSPLSPFGPGGPVHPRMRGERDAWRMSKRGYAGSSPHARGTPVRTGWPCLR